MTLILTLINDLWWCHKNGLFMDQWVEWDVLNAEGCRPDQALPCVVVKE